MLTTRSALIPVDISRTSPKIKFKAKLNGKPVNSFIYSSYECLGLRVTEKAHKPQLFIQLPEVDPMSVNLLSIESHYNIKKNNQTDPEFAKETQSRRVHVLDENSVLENDELLVQFDRRTFMPNEIYFKSLDQKVNLEMQVIRYPTTNSQSGAYIFAPKDEGIPLKLQILDAFILQGDDQDRLIVFYKSRYTANV